MNASAESPKDGSGKVSPPAYNSLVAAARLREIRLIKSEFALDPESLGIKATDWKLAYDCEIQNAEYEAESKMLVAFVTAQAFCKKGAKRILSAKCRYVVVYDVHGTPEDDVVSVFAKRVARFAVYPYFRAHFAETCSQAGLQLPPLPVIKETRLLQKLSPTQTDQKKLESGTEKTQRKSA